MKLITYFKEDKIMSKTLKTILISLSIVLWTVIVAILSMTYGIMRQQDIDEAKINNIVDSYEYQIMEYEAESLQKDSIIESQNIQIDNMTEIIATFSGLNSMFR